MVDLTDKSGKYNNAIEACFYEYFDKRDISVYGLDYKQIDNSLFEAAFSYVYQKLFKPDHTTVRYNNKKTKIDLKDIDELYTIADIYIDIVKGFNIIPFDIFFLKLTGIHPDTWNSWKNEEYSHGGLSTLYSDLYKTIHDLPKQQTRNKLANQMAIALANNDEDVGLTYEKNKQPIYNIAVLRNDTPLPIRDDYNCLEIGDNLQE